MATFPRLFCTLRSLCRIPPRVVSRTHLSTSEVAFRRVGQFCYTSYDDEDMRFFREEKETRSLQHQRKLDCRGVIERFETKYTKNKLDVPDGTILSREDKWKHIFSSRPKVEQEFCELLKVDTNEVISRIVKLFDKLPVDENAAAGAWAGCSIEAKVLDDAEVVLMGLICYHLPVKYLLIPRDYDDDSD